MKQIIEEYGRVFVVGLAVLAIMGILFFRLDFIGVLGTVADVDTGISHGQGESALGQVVEREKPTGDFSGVSLRVYQDQVFQPLKGVTFRDADGRTVAPVVTSILYCDFAGNEVELVDYYNHRDDVIVLNPSHYANAHGVCGANEFTVVEGGLLAIPEGMEQNSPGIVVVTYLATDCEKQVTVETLSFVIDNLALKK